MQLHLITVGLRNRIVRHTIPQQSVIFQDMISFGHFWAVLGQFPRVQTQS